MRKNRRTLRPGHPGGVSSPFLLGAVYITPQDVRRYYPMLIGNVCITSKTRPKMSTLQMVAPIPAFMAGSILWLRRRNDAAGFVFVFRGVIFSIFFHTSLPARVCGPDVAGPA